MKEDSKALTVVLYHPQIPQNTGNIIRTCSVTNTGLILIPPLGFSMDEKSMRRAGLDYHEGVSIQIVPTLEEVISQAYNPVILSSHAKKSFFDLNSINSMNTARCNIESDKPLASCDMLIFGNETAGIGSENTLLYSKYLRKIPMIENARCLNLSNAVAICIYEMLRQKSWSNGKSTLY